MYQANICLFDPVMVVFVDESGFVSSQAANLHIAKVYFACPYEEVVIAGQENPTKDKMNYFDNIVVWFFQFLAFSSNLVMQI